MDDTAIARLGGELHRALRGRTTVAPLTAREPALTIADSYRVSRHVLAARIAEGERVIGKKIGVTSKPVQRMLDVHQPDFGWLTDRMAYPNGSEMPISRLLIQPRAEGELAFVLARDLRGPGITAADVLRATDHVKACFEIVDSRITDWKIRIEDTVADNASSGLFLLGDEAIDPRALDMYASGMVVEKNGEIISTGAAAAALGSPAECVAWLANTLAGFDVPLVAGEIILSGSWVPLESVAAGDRMKVTIGGVGSATVTFT